MSYLSGLYPEWPIANLGKIVKRSQYGLSEPSTETGVPYLKMGSIVDGKVLLGKADRLHVTEEILDQYRLNKGDILFNRTNSLALVGKSGVVKESCDAVFASYLIRIEVDRKRAVPEFVAHWLNTSRAKSRLRALATPGVSQANINPTTLKLAFHLPLPPLPEQRKIADILSTWDHALETLDKLIKAKEKQKRGLMQQLLTGKKRLPGFEVRWRTRKLAEIRRRLEEKNNGRTDRPLSMTARVGFVDQRAKWKRDIAGVSFENYVYLERGDFSYNKGNSKAYPCGCVYRLEEFDDGVVPKVFYSFRISSKEIDHEFLKQYFLAGHHNRQLTRLINSGVRNDGLLNLAARDFFSIDVPVPPIEEQRRIASVLSTADQEISFLKQKRDALNDQKRGLMQQLLTGNVRVKLEEDAA